MLYSVVACSYLLCSILVRVFAGLVPKPFTCEEMGQGIRL